jgi:RNA polymerase sigma-70 factor (ECF subfamily)
MFGSLPTPEEDADRDAVAALARKHRPALLRYFQRKGFRPPDDEDAAQEVFIRLARREGLSEQVERFDSYLFAAAANVALDLRRMGQVRAAGKHDRYDDSLHALREHDPEQILQGRQALDALVMALKELPDRTRTIFVLARLEHMKQAEIARRLGVSLNTVEKHLQSAIAHLGARTGRGR